MLQTPFDRRRGGLRLLRARAVSGLRSNSDRHAHRVFERLRQRTGPRRESRPTAARQKRPKREGERVLLLLDCRVVSGRIHRGVVHVAVAVSDLFHSRVRTRAVCGGILVPTRRAKARIGRVRSERELRPTRECLIETYSRMFWSDDMSGRIGFPRFTHLKRPASTLPNGGGPIRL